MCYSGIRQRWTLPSETLQSLASSVLYIWTGVMSISTLQTLFKAPVTSVLVVLAIACQLAPGLGGSFEVDLSYGSIPGLQGLIGCHMLHWSWEHLWWDVAMFGLLGVICELQLRRSFYATLIIAALSIPIVIQLVQPEISTYRGLSGLDTAIFALLATHWLFESYRGCDWPQGLLGGGLLACLIGKLAWEFFSGSTLFVTEVNFIPLPLAHAAGAGCGIMLVLCQHFKSGVQHVATFAGTWTIYRCADDDML